MAYKKTICATLIASASAATTVYLLNDKRRNELKTKSKDIYQKVCSLVGKEKKNSRQLRMGHPDPYDIEDQKMVDEGALYSVKHYNQTK
ncbi:hypothetical protein [Alkalihalobacillus pseudalcaliphilus]|uniref:hypothetical protein n=1 Tax=Alkalihalobacillus pseudalcaliphilus TaxID=79884 RepID=UPI00064E0D50|nr:hypothetical protein [Alkalihalobacillus pseudalcaliphilus]KMK74752.1 hypothetical protein AB990_19905 [Alkalihalobacillus pseudalcaliphilus]